MNEHLCIAHKDIHTEPCVSTVPDTQSAYVKALTSQNHQETPISTKHKQPPPTHAPTHPRTHPLPEEQPHRAVEFRTTHRTKKSNKTK